jgi:putative transcriptional regulator
VKYIHLNEVLNYDIFLSKEGENIMSIQYKIDVLAELKKKGYSTYRLRKERIFGEATIQKIRMGELVSWDNISTMCRLLECQPGDIVKYTE